MAVSGRILSVEASIYTHFVRKTLGLLQLLVLRTPEETYKRQAAVQPNFLRYTASGSKGSYTHRRRKYLCSFFPQDTWSVQLWYLERLRKQFTQLGDTC